MARKLEVQIIGDSSSLEHAFRKAGNASSGFGSAIGKVAKAAALGTAALGAGMAAGIGIGIKSLMEHEKADARLANVLKTTGNAANTNVEAIAKLANEMEKKSGIDDVLIKSGAGLLLTFKNIQNAAGEGNDMFDQSVKIANDLSVALGKDLQSSALMVGKALNDPIKGLTALGRAGVQFTEGQKEQIKAMVESGNVMGAQKLIMKELTSQVGGAAEALGGTMAGRLNILKARLEEVAESVAARLLPVFERLVAWVERNWPQIQRVITTVFAAVQAVFQSVATWVRDHWTEIEATVRGVFEGISATWEHVLRPVLSALMEGLGEAINWVRDNWPQISATVSRVMEDVRAVIQTVVGVVMGIWNRFGEDILSVLRIAWSFVESTVRNALRVIQGIIDVFVGVLTGDWGRAWDGIKNIVGGVFDQIGNVISTAVSTLGALARALGKAIVDALKAGVGVVADIIHWDDIAHGAEVAFGAVRSAGETAIRWIRDAWGAVSGFFSGIFDAIEKFASDAWSFLHRGALTAALAVVEPFSHLPSKLGQWARDAKDVFNRELSRMDAQAAIDKVVRQVNSSTGEFGAAGAAAGNEWRVRFLGSATPAIDALLRDVRAGAASASSGFGQQLGASINREINTAKSIVQTEQGMRSPSTVWARDVGLPIVQGIASGIVQGGKVVLTEVQQVARDAMATARETLTQAKTTLHDIVKADDFLTPAQITRANALFRQIGLALRDKSITEDDLNAIRGKLDRLGEMASEATEKMAAAVEAKRGRVVGAYDHLTGLIVTGFQRLGDDQIRIQEQTTQRSIDEYTKSLSARTDLTDEARSDMVRIFETQARETLAVWTRNYSDMRTEQEHHLGLAITTLQTKLGEGQISAGKFQAELKKIMSAAGVDTKTQAEIMGTALSGNIEKAVSAVLKAMGGFATGTKTHFDTAEGHASRSLKKVGDAAQTARGHLGDMSRYESEANATLSRIQNIARSVTTGGQLPTQYQASGGEQPAGSAPANSQLQLLISRDPANAAYYRSLSQTQRTAILRSMGLQSGVRNWRGGWALVGESGAEMVNLPRGSDVYPAQQTAAMLGGGGGGGELTVRAPVYLDSRQIGEVVYQYLLDRSRSSGSLFSASPGVRL